jgi:hypothetical protein
LKFGFGHCVRIGIDGLRCLRRKKHLARHSLLLVGPLWFYSLEVARCVRDKRVMGAYTKRGIRLSRQHFYKRKGKESRYTALKSKIF